MSNETTKEFLNAQYNVADMSLQLKMLLWRAAKAKYMVRLMQNCIDVYQYDPEFYYMSLRIHRI